MRKQIVAGNWKMNKRHEEGIELAREIYESIREVKPSDVDIVICAPFTHISSIINTIDTKIISTGAQNCSNYESGAYTGEISAGMIESLGAEYVIIGHSERRAYFNESDEILAEKVNIALKNNLKPIFCCGEILKDREAENHFKVVSDQLEKGLFHLDSNQLDIIVIAYEPVWAIGTGVTASSDQAQEMHKFIRGLIYDKYGQDSADNMTILYGGSCNAKNAGELFAMDDVDGGLIGGASLKPDDFCTIIKSF